MFGRSPCPPMFGRLMPPPPPAGLFFNPSSVLLRISFTLAPLPPEGRSFLMFEARSRMLLPRFASRLFLMFVRSRLASWFLSMLIFDRSTFFQSISLKLALPLKFRLLRQLLQSISTSPPFQRPPHTPQSSQSTAAAHKTPVTAAAKKGAVG